MNLPIRLNRKRRNRVRTPNILQMEAVECGAACLSIVLAYYGKYLSLENLRTDCDVNRDGSKASNIVKAAKLHGLNAKGYRKDLDDLAEVNLPAIIHWNFNHFVVLEGISADRAYINDPASGHRVASIEEMNKSFTGVVLTFEAGENFKKSGKPPGITSVLGERLHGYRTAVTFIVLIGLMLVIPGLLLPVFSRIFVDDILIGGADDWFSPLIIGMIITAILRSVLEWLKSYYLLRTTTKLALTSSAHFFWHVLRLPINFFNQRYSGEVGSRLSINDKIAYLLSGQLASNILSIIIVIFYLAVMVQYDIVLTLIGVGLSLLNILGLKIIAAKRSEEYRKFSQAQGKLLGVSMGGLQIIETLKATGRENDFFIKWSGHLAKVINAEQNLASLSIVLNAIPLLINSLITAVILVVGAVRVMDGDMTIGMLVAFQSLMWSFAAPIHSIIGLGSKLQETEGDINRLEDVLKSKVDPQTEKRIAVTDGDYSKVAKKLEGYVEFRNVTFGYSRFSSPLIKDFNLKLNPGERIALVGGSGSGKSTIAKLLAGIYEPWSGEILLDGVPRDQWARQIINNSIAMVDQDIFLFEAPVRDLLTLWDTSVTDQMLIRAAKDAQIHDTISTKADGYDFVVSEGGRNFSGGQQQRMEIARALVGNPSVLILDEATSALDPITEKNIDEAIKKRKCSVLVVAHRLSTIRDSNEIIVMKNGSIVERGTHEELKKNEGVYWELIKK